MLASWVVRNEDVWQSCGQSMFWFRVDRTGQSQLLRLLDGFARHMGATPMDLHTTYTNASITWMEYKVGVQHVKAVASKNERLVVLDDVWARERVSPCNSY